MTPPIVVIDDDAMVRTSIQRIHVEAVTKVGSRLGDYVLKTILNGRLSYDEAVVVLGIRPKDEYRMELRAAGIAFRAVPELRSDGAARSAQWARNVLEECDGYWVHVDLDVLDPSVLPGETFPAPGGLDEDRLQRMLTEVAAGAQVVGCEITNLTAPDLAGQIVLAARPCTRLPERGRRGRREQAIAV